MIDKDFNPFEFMRHFTYKPSVKLAVVPHWRAASGLALEVERPVEGDAYNKHYVLGGVTDEGMPVDEFTLHGDAIIPPWAVENEHAFATWLTWFLVQGEVHEGLEWAQVDGKPVVDTHPYGPTTQSKSWADADETMQRMLDAAHDMGAIGMDPVALMDMEYMA